MSKANQCPSTIGERDAAKPLPAPERSDATGRQLWRSLDELADTREFRDFLEREFPAHASELSDPTRRGFLRLMGASLALAGAATIPGCRRPDHRIMPFNKQPEDLIPGKPLFYATAMPLPGGGAEGLLVETHEGRPTKIEGNPLHPINQGRTSVLAQASVLNLYDPDRLTVPSRMTNNGRVESSWAEFERFAGEHFRQFDQANGAGLVFLVDKTTSPSRDRMRDRVLQRWPEAVWLPYEAVDDDNAREGARIAFGQAMTPQLHLAGAKVILSIDQDFLSGEEATLPAARGFAAGRRVLETQGEGARMSRLYAVESTMSLVGGMADHRLRLKPSQIQGYVVALARAVFDRVGGGYSAGPIGQALASRADDVSVRDIDREWIDAVADDLVEHRGEAVVTVGRSQPAQIHAIVHAMNAALEAMGRTVRMQPARGDTAANSLESIRRLQQLVNTGSIDTLVVFNANPVYDAPADLSMHELYARIPTTIQLAVDANETGALSTWRLNGCHAMESWGDVIAHDGTMSIVQPMIAPLFEGRTELELTALILGDEKRDGYEIVRQTWRASAPGMQSLSDSIFEKRWRRVLHNGLLEGTTTQGVAPSLNNAAIASAISAMEAPPSSDGLEIVFHADRRVYDGRYANNGWLQEFPDPVSKATWDNPAMISASTAQRLGVSDGDLVEIEVGGRSMQIAVFRQPGMADDTLALSLGGGREESGRIGAGVGFNTYLLRASGSLRTAHGATVTRTRRRYDIACVQSHWAMEGRPIIREFDVQAWRKHGDDVVQKKDHYGNQKPLNFAQRAGTESHTPANEHVYKPGQQHDWSTRPQWGMSIDLATCSGCGACTIACQAENNIPVVGKHEVLKGREMHWIRVDRYYASADPHEEDRFTNDYGDAGPYTGGRRRDDVDMLVQPVACVHCEAAPCETVCPVNATIHGAGGTNDMAYNRCIGTRYCLNNCPYKVRRFNFFDYATKRLHGDYVGKNLLGGIVKNEQLIPPRLREKVGDGVGEIQTMQNNPNVTVRERGVMEKCTYCMQRINASRIEAELQGLDQLPDGFFQTACQQACPTESIVFGDILDPLSKVKALREHNRSYMLLDYLNTRPRTTYMAGLRNPNPRLRDPIEDPFHSYGGDDHAAAPHDEGHVMSLPVLSTNGVLA